MILSIPTLVRELLKEEPGRGKLSTRIKERVWCGPLGESGDEQGEILTI